jgi:hypothetical protein
MKPWSKWFSQQALIDAAVVSGVAAIAFYQVKRRLAARRNHQAETAQRINTWEGEGGNVPSVPTVGPGDAGQIESGLPS